MLSGEKYELLKTVEAIVSFCRRVMLHLVAAAETTFLQSMSGSLSDSENNDFDKNSVAVDVSASHRGAVTPVE